MRIGDVGSKRPIAMNSRLSSKTTARSPASPPGVTETIDESNTHGCPPRICLAASLVTRTASRLGTRLASIGADVVADGSGIEPASQPRPNTSKAMFTPIGGHSDA